MKKKVLTLLLSVTMIVSLIGCGQSAETGGTSSDAVDQTTEKALDTSKDSDATYKETLNIAYNAQPTHFDTAKTGATATAEITRNVFESLFESDANGEPQCQLCESYEVSDDNKNWVFHLRQGVLFHNGEEMKADDVVASMNRWLDLDSIARRSIPTEYFEKVDDYTVALNLEEPCIMLPYMIANFAQYAPILPASIINEVGTDTLEPDQLIGTGGFKFAEWATDNYVKLEKFEDYKPFTTEKSGFYGDRTAYVDEVYFYFVTDPTTRLNGLETGEYDIAASVAYSDYDRLQSMDGVEMMTSNFNGLTITMNKGGESRMTDKTWRQIIGYAIDLDEIMEGAIPSAGDYCAYDADACYFPKDSIWYSDVSANASQDVEKAKELLKEINYDGTPLVMLTTEAYPEFYNACLIMQQQLEAVGINVELKVQDWGTMLTSLSQTDDSWDLYPMNYPLANSPATIAYLFKTNASGFTNDETLNNYLLEMQGMSSMDEVLDFWSNTVMPYCSESNFITHLGCYDYLYGVSEKVEGFDPYYGCQVWGVKVAE